MRKFVVFALVALMSSLLLCGASYAQQKADRECAARIKTLSQAVELWANDNGGKFPTREEFESEAFLKYVKKADPAGNTIGFQAWSDGQADGFFCAGGICHEEICVQGIQIPQGAFHGGIEAL